MISITVVITSYNLEGYIGTCINELLDQTFQEFKILIVDDCSTDGTTDIVQEFINHYPQKIEGIFLTKNLASPSRTRNYAMDSGRIEGKYVIFLDGDDRIEQNFLEGLFFSIEENAADVAICAYDRVDVESGKILCKEMSGFPKCIEVDNSAEKLAFLNGSLWNRIWRYDAIAHHRFPDFKVGEDLAFQLGIYLEIKKISFIDHVLIHYGVRRNSVISNTAIDTIYKFSENLLLLCTQNKSAEWLELATFIHIGISMLFRAADNPDIDLRKHIAWTRKFFFENFDFMKKNKYLKLNSLKANGLRGYAIYFVLWMYRHFGILLFVKFYKLVIRTFRIDIKF